MTNTSYNLLAVLQHYAPDEAARQKCADIYEQMKRDLMTDRQMDVQLAEAILDVLRYGNGPWNQPVAARSGHTRWLRDKHPTAQIETAPPDTESCGHCDGSGYCTRRACSECEWLRNQVEDSTCGVCRGMCRVPVKSDDQP